MAESRLKIGTGEAIKDRLGLKAADYQGGKSTPSAHAATMRSRTGSCALLRDEREGEEVAKFSGIGCSSKTPAYFLQRSHGFDSVHARMPAVATGVTRTTR